MRIIKRSTLAAYWQRNPQATTGLLCWHKLAKQARWTCLQDVRATFPHADAVTVASGRSVVVFNIAGNKYRLITAIHYNRQLLFTLMVLCPMSKPTTKTDFRRLPKTYSALVAMFPPRPIHDDVHLANATEVIDRLAGFALTPDQEDYLEAIATFVEAYEAERFPLDESRLTPLDAVKALLAEHGMSASDLGRLLGNRTLGAAILSGRRALSKVHIKKLAEHFKVEPGLFL